MNFTKVNTQGRLVMEKPQLSGRRRGEEDRFSHYRRGFPGDLRNYFDDTIIEKFKDTTRDVVMCLGYKVKRLIMGGALLIVGPEAHPVGFVDKILTRSGGFPKILKRIIPGRMKRIAMRCVLAFRHFLEEVLFDHKLRRATPIFVFQMGKVGSVSIYNSLSKLYPGVVLHAHSFSTNDKRWEIRRLYHWTISENRPLIIISFTREPIGRNVSAFFQNFERETGVPYDRANFSPEELKAIFLSHYPHETPLLWFDKQIKVNLGIDVYATPFPKCGYATYSHRNIRLLVMRAEIADNEKANLIRDFLGLTEFQLVNTNIGEEKDYGLTYRDFKSMVKLPSDYIAKMCESKYFSHFYGQEAIDAARMKWSES